MTTRFAGSRSLDERRRRRLAAESNNPDLNNDLPVSEDSPARADADDFSQQSAAVQFPLHKVISQKMWKHWAVAFFGLALGAGILYCGHHAADLEEKLGPGFARLFNLSSGPVFRCYRSILLILSGQLALLIFWARSRSLQDFAGRYRLWVWVAGAWFWFAFSTASGAHHAWSESVVWLWWDAPLRNRTTLCWLIPAVLLGAELLWMMHRDMRGCRSSLSMLWLAAGLLLTAGVQTLLTDVGWSELTQPAVAMGGVLCLFTSMLLHARHVIYQSAEPPQRRPFRLPIRLPRIRLPKLRFRSHKRTQNLSVVGADNNDSPSSAIKTKTQVKADAAAPKVAASEPTAGQPATKKKAKVRPKTTESTEAMREICLDRRPDEELLKGLSKRERRKLRKQWREQKRSAAT